MLTSDLILTSALAMAPKGIGPYIRQHFLDTTFRGLYHANAFDMALLIPYFIVLILLAAYGMHRYVLVYLYYKHRKNRTTEPAQLFEELPRVTVQLPIFNEQYVVERLLESICKLKYPREKLDIQVLDDSTDETVEVARGLVERYAALGNPISYHHRTNREGYKAGALAEGLKTAKGEFIAIFDADFTPPEDFLLLTIHHFTDPKIGMVQTRWTHLNRHYSFLTEVEAILLDGHFVLEHSGRARTGLFFNFNGTAGMWRRTAIDEAGGWQHDTLTEDTDLSYRAQLEGMEVYLPAGCRVPRRTAGGDDRVQDAAGALGQGPDSDGKEDSAAGAAERRAAAHQDRGLVSPDGEHELSADDHAVGAAAAGHDHSLLSGLVPDALHRPAAVHGVDVFDFKLLSGLAARTVSAKLASGAALSAISDGAGDRPDDHQHESRDRSADRQEERVCAHAEVSAWCRSRDKVGATKYRKRLGWVPWIELVIGTYFALTVYYAIDNENYITVPFLLLFVVGYWYTGLMSLLQGRFGGRALSATAHTKPFPVGV